MMKWVHSPDWAALSALLASRPRQDEEHDFILLDGAQDERLLQRLRRTHFPWVSVFTQERDGDKALQQVSPLLLEWSGEAIETLFPLLQACDGKPMFSLWRSRENLEQLAGRLWSWCVVNADGSYFNLRFADTRRLHDLVAVLREEQAATLWGAARFCLLPTRQGTWCELALPGKDLPPVDEVELDTEQTVALITAAEADETLFQLQFHSVVSADRLADIYPLIAQTLQQADRHGVEGQEERYGLCIQALDRHHVA